MATSDVQLCSNALMLLGADPINSFDDDADRARLASNLWPNACLAVLRSFPWDCSIKRVSLAPDAAAPAFEFSYAFTKPGDWLRTLSIGEEGDAITWRNEGTKILMDEAECKLRYVYRNTDVTTWDALLVMAGEAYMAMLLAYPVTKSQETRKAMTDLYQFQLRQARTVESLEQPAEDVGDKPFIDVRR